MAADDDDDDFYASGGGPYRPGLFGWMERAAYSLWWAIRWPFDALTSAWWRFRADFAERGDGWRAIISFPMYLLGLAYAHLANPTSAWSWWENIWSLALGLPAALIGLMAIIFGSLAWSRSDASIVAQYDRAAQVALAKEDYETARICYERMTWIMPDSPRRFGLARIHEIMNHPDDATAMMESLAASGYGPAHAWLALRILRSKPSLDPQAQQEALSHLLLAYDADPRDLEVNAQLATIYLKRDEPDKAEPHLGGLVATNPEALFLMADCEEARGESLRARRRLETAYETFAGKVQREPHNREARLRFVDAAERLDRFKEAKKALDDGLALHPNEPEYYVRLAGLQLDLADRLPGGVRVDQEQRQALLQTGLDYLQTASKSGFSSMEHASLLAKAYLGLKRYSDAEPILAQLASVRPDLRLELANVYEREGKTAQARENFEMARAVYEERMTRDPYDHKSRLFWVDALLARNEFAQAERLLKLGSPLLGEDPRQRTEYDRRFADLYVRMAQAEGAKPNPDWARQLELLQLALDYNWENGAAIHELVGLSNLSGEPAAKARAAIESLLTQGRAPALMHFLLGNQSWAKGDAAGARRHFEQAYQLKPRMAEVANNLAWVIAHSESPDLAQAVSIMNSVIERSNDNAENPMFRDTRGRIHAKMGSWKESLADFEVARRAAPNEPQYLRAIALAYEKLGDPAMAERHRKLADQGGSGSDPRPTAPMAPTPIAVGATGVDSLPEAERWSVIRNELKETRAMLEETLASDRVTPESVRAAVDRLVELEQSLKAGENQAVTRPGRRGGLESLIDVEDEKNK